MASIKELKKKLIAIEKDIFAITLELNSTKNTTNLYYATRRKKINELYDRARIIFRDWANMEIPNEYNNQLRESIKIIKGLKTIDREKKRIKFNNFKNNPKNLDTIDKLKNSTINDFTLATERGEKKYIRLIRTTQQLNVIEREIEEAAAEGLKGSQSVQRAKNAVKEKLMKDALDKKYITIIDKNGNKINYKIDYYAELVARTKTRETTTEAIVNTAARIENDLIQVSSHNTTTPFDAQFEGKVYSLSGQSKLFPVVQFLPPFHPNCLHTISLYFQEAHTEKELKAISDFSKGRIEKHPTRKSHKPISERGFKK